MIMSRRSFLSSGAALGAAWMTGLGGCAAHTPRARSLAPGVARIDLGKVQVTMLNDGHSVRPLDAGFVTNATLADVQAALASAGLPTDRIEIPFHPLLVEVRGRRVLFDTGNGEFGSNTAGRLLESLALAGIAPDTVDAVVISHFHGDHINGLRNKAGQITFPNARIYVPEPEWNWWMDDARMAASPEARRGGFLGSRRVFGPLAESVIRFTPGSEVLPGLRSLPAHGHTPGHTAFLIEGGRRKLLFWADTTNVAALFVRNPDWSAVFDMDADAARKTRHLLAEQVINEDLLLAGYHLSGAGIGTLVRRGQGYDFIPLSVG